MKLNRKLITGLVVILAGSTLVQLSYMINMEAKNARLIQYLGFALIVIGIVPLYQGKKQQEKDRER